MTWLKRLIMDGFKSYGSKRVELPLTRGFNAVIGPNGSGKSNIVDAMLFVLGGLSTKTMRAGALTDLIFAGTPDEKPSLKTRVEMVLNNTDHQIPLNTDEVRISREVRKTGSSVYRLNGKISTRKEIVDLLTLGNIGVHSRNIVLQGEIIHLITQTPQERRELVESVAGITEFDEKRLEAESELAKAQVRYREIDLLLGGLRESRDRLTQEKMEAERYLHLQLEIENKTALLLAVRTVLLKSKLEQLNQRVDKHQKTNIILQQKMSHLEFEKVKISEQLLKLDQKHAALQDQELKQLIPLLDKKRAEKIEFESKAAFEREKITKYQDEYQVLIQKVEDLMKAREQLTPHEASLNEQISDVSFIIEEKTEELGNLRKEKDELDKTLEKDRMQVRVLNKDLEGKKQQKVEYETRIKFLHSNFEKNSELHAEFASKCKELQTVVNDLENNLNILNKHRIEATESLKQTRDQVENYREQKAVLDNNLKTTLKMLNQTESTKIKLETELQVLRDEKTDEALTASADAIHLAVKQGDLELLGIQGPISTMFNIPHELRKLLSTTFPTIMGALVVSNINSALKIMDYAKRKQLGRVSIIVRDLINLDNKNLSNSIMKSIDCSESDYTLGMYLFGNICLMDSMTEINIDSNIYITPQGEIIDTARAQVIGADTGLTRISNLHNKFIPKLQKTYDDQLHQKLHYEQENKSLIKEIEKLNNHLREGEARINEHTQQDRTIRNDLERSRVQLSDLKHKVTDLNKQDAENKKDLNKLNTIIQEIYTQIPILEGNLNKLNESLESGSRKEIEQHLYQLQDELDELRVDETDLRLEFEKIQTRKNELIEPGIQNGVLRQEELLRQIEIAKLQTENLTQQFHQAEKELSTYTTQIENTRNQMTLLSEQRDDHRTTHNALVEEIAQFINETNQVQLLITKLELEKKQYEGELEEVNRSAARLGTPHHFEPETLSGLEPSILRKELLEHQREKDELGSVNLKAPVQYAEIDQRYTMILKKRETLSKERKIIIETIEELELKKRTLFFLTFDKLNKHFNELFIRLSPGQDSFAKLILENEQDPFEGGVLLEARPQGKRIKSITSMSGGEKSLAALALLFAIQKVESSPFYVFDEIDAFLDVANVNKVAELLSEQSKDTQILLVTLREPMMALADQLYAVSNINGISCVFGLNLQDILEGKIQLDLEQGDELVDSRI